MSLPKKDAHIYLDHCPSCVNVYTGHAGSLRCRVNGLKASPANAEGCKRYEREAGSDDVPMVWFRGGWVCDSQGRGD